MRRALALSASAWLLVGCGIMPAVPDPLLDAREIASRRKAGDGILAFATRFSTPRTVLIDVRNLETGKRFRLSMNPSFTRKWQTPLANPRLDSLWRQRFPLGEMVVYALPAGRYLPMYGFPVIEGSRERYGVAVQADTFRIAQDTLTSLGRLRIDYPEILFQAPSLRVNSTKEPIDGLIGRGDSALAGMPRLRQRFAANQVP